MNPRVLAFDVIETLFSLDRLGQRMRDAGLSSDALSVFFAHLLRDGFALAATDIYVPFRELAKASLEVLLAGAEITSNDATVNRGLEGFADLDAHPDVAEGLDHARAAGARILALTNGSARSTELLLTRSGLTPFFERIVSIDEVEHWKPRREVYLHAARLMNAEPSSLALIAAHAWDVHGAKQAGLHAGWIRRTDRRFLSSMTAPDAEGDALAEVVDLLMARTE